MSKFTPISKKQLLESVRIGEEDDLDLVTILRTLTDNRKFWAIKASELPSKVVDEIIDYDFIGSPAFESKNGITQFGLYGTETDGPTSLAFMTNYYKTTFYFTVGSNTYTVLTEKGLI
jgi:hypothetical protein